MLQCKADGVSAVFDHNMVILFHARENLADDLHGFFKPRIIHVTIAKSANRSAISPIIGRFKSRLPPRSRTNTQSALPWQTRGRFLVCFQAVRCMAVIQNHAVVPPLGIQLLKPAGNIFHGQKPKLDVAIMSTHSIKLLMVIAERAL